MIIINNFKIINNGTQIQLDMSSDVGSTFTSLNLWTTSTYKNLSLAKNLTSLLIASDNTENIIISAAAAGVTKFEDLIFIEVNTNLSNSTVTSITYELSAYYNCLLKHMLELSISDCINCDKENDDQLVITINLLLDMVVKTITVGYVSQAIDAITKLKKLCSLVACKDCPTLECSTCNNFIQF
jgi:hypothetical protein